MRLDFTITVLLWMSQPHAFCRGMAAGPSVGGMRTKLNLIKVRSTSQVHARKKTN